MAQVSANPGSRDPQRTAAGSPWATGPLLFAGLMMVVNGVFSILFGIMAAADNSVYNSVPAYAFRFNLTSWGWIHLIVGVLLAASGVAVLAEAAWGRAAGIGAASIAMFVSFLVVPYFPLWAVIGLAIDVFVIRALALAD